MRRKQAAVEIIRIRREDETDWYKFEDKDQLHTFHKELCEISTMKQALSGMKKVNQIRNTRVTLSNELMKIYLDEEGNFKFGKDLLMPADEVSFMNHSQAATDSNILESDYLDYIKKLQLTINEREELKLMDIEKRFSLDKYDGKENARDWIENFEKECRRYGILENRKKIDVLKLYLKDGPRDWYHTQISNMRNEPFDSWTKEFIDIFGVSSWKTIKEAYTFHYRDGKYLDYGLKKQRKLLETDKDMTVKTMLNLITLGLPYHVQEKLDLNEQNTLSKYFGELSKLCENKKSSSRKFEPRKSDFKTDRTGSSQEREECKICIAANSNWSGRFHPPEKCWNNKKNKDEKESNVLETSEDEVRKFLNIESD